MLYSAKKENINKHIQEARIHSKVIPQTKKHMTSAASPWPAERVCVQGMTVTSGSAVGCGSKVEMGAWSVVHDCLQLETSHHPGSAVGL